MKILKFLKKLFKEEIVLTGYLKVPDYIEKDILIKSIKKYNEKDLFFVCKYNKLPPIFVKFDEIIGKVVNIPLKIDRNGNIKIKMLLLNTISGKLIKKIIKRIKEIEIKFIPIGVYNNNDFHISYIQMEIIKNG